MLLVPHLALLAVLTWAWGIRDAGLFVAYSLALGSVYLGMELRLIEAMPFSRQFQAKQAMMLPLLIGGGLGIAIVVGLQYVLIFRSPVAALAATGIASATAWYLTKGSLKTLAVSIRYNLGLVSEETKGIYQEVEL